MLLIYSKSMTFLPKIFLLTFISSLFLLPISTFAQGANYTLLEPEIIVDGSGESPDFATYAKNAYQVFLIIVVFLTVLMFIVGGLEYMASSIPAVKAEGLSRIKAATWGLILALSSYLILNIINPELLTVDLNLTRVGENIQTPVSGGGGGGDDETNGGGTPIGPVNPLDVSPGTALSGSIPETPDCSTNSECVSLRDRGANVANWEGINGNGRTDRVHQEVAEATILVQQDLASNHNLNTQITAAHTNGVGHSDGSRHYEGIAIDIQPTGGNITQSNLRLIEESCKRAGFTYTLIENRHVHCDAR